jgi:hypothetical protein
MISSIETNFMKEDFKERSSIFGNSVLLIRSIFLLFLIYYIIVYLSLFLEYYYFIFIFPMPKFFNLIIFVIGLIPYTLWAIFPNLTLFILDFIFP